MCIESCLNANLMSTSPWEQNWEQNCSMSSTPTPTLGPALPMKRWRVAPDGCLMNLSVILSSARSASSRCLASVGQHAVGASLLVVLRLNAWPLGALVDRCVLDAGRRRVRNQASTMAAQYAILCATQNYALRRTTLQNTRHDNLCSLS